MSFLERFFLCKVCICVTIFFKLNFELFEFVCVLTHIEIAKLIQRELLAKGCGGCQIVMTQPHRELALMKLRNVSWRE